MNWTYFKTNWFSIALGLLVLAVVVRGSGRLSLQHFFSTEDGKYAEISPASRKSTALGIASEPSIRPPSPVEVDQATAAAFLKRFASVAVSERKKFGVPASVLLATAFLNSHIGLNDAALEANNFFGLPCSNDWEGESVSLAEHCFRKYETPWASWRDFSIYLSSQEWFGSLRQTAGKDWHKWVKGLNGKNISKLSNCGQKIGEVIDYYRLYELDLP